MLSTLGATGLTQGFLGSAVVKANPIYVTDGIWKIGGIITDTTYTAYFGRVVSSNEATMNDWLMGAQGAVYVGVLINEAGVNQNEPFKNNYRLPLEPATAVKRGWILLNSWTHAATGALTVPTRTSIPIYDILTGNIEFVAVNTAIPVGFSILPATVEFVDTANQGALLWLEGAETADSTSTPITSEIALTSVTGGTVRAIFGEISTFSTGMTSGTVMGVRGEANIYGSIATSFIYGTEGKAILKSGSSVADGSAYVAGVVGQLDLSGGTTTSGHIACVIGSIQDTTGLIAGRAVVDAFYAECPAYGSGGGINSAFKGYGSTNYVFDFSGIHAASGLFLLPAVGSSGFTTAAATGLSTLTSAGYINIVIGSTTYKIYYV